MSSDTTTHGLFLSYIEFLSFFRANLSESYFTNRQDRYILVEDCDSLADFFDRLVGAISSCSFAVKSDGSIHYDSDSVEHPYNGS